MSAAMVESASSTAVEELEHEAFAKGLLAVDSARRVGWAKAFEALRRIDGLEEEVRQMRDERKYLRRSYSRLLGCIQHSGISRTPLLDEELGRHFAAERSFRDVGAWEKGRSIGEEHLASVKQWTEQEVEHRRIEVAAKLKRHKAAVRSLRRLAAEAGHVADRRARQYGFTASCSCGEAERGLSERDAQQWKLDHLAAVLGTTFDDFRATWKSEHSLEEYL